MMHNFLFLQTVLLDAFFLGFIFLSHGKSIKNILILIFLLFRQPLHVPPLYVHSFASISNTISSWCQYEALKYISFPTQVFKFYKYYVINIL